MSRNTLVVRHDPFFMPLRDAMDTLFNDSFISPVARNWATVWGIGSRLPINIYADADGYTFVAVVPGLKADDVTIEVEGNTLKLSGETIAPAISADEKVRALRSEIGFGKFNRSFELPDAIDATQIDANLENGLLTVRVAKAETVKPRSIKVQAK
ncbi:MAG TPA: Hsp20/alpha crystallin family protein [Anaerolineae bacterium]|nr:Hsp20/alpha crystallin family protein [Anaerolineae bacterium]